MGKREDNDSKETTSDGTEKRKTRLGLMTVEEVAEEFGVNRFTIYRWVNAGELRAVKIGQQFRFRQKDLEEFVDSRLVKPRSKQPGGVASELG